MKRTVLLCGLGSFVMAFLGTVAALALAFPANLILLDRQSQPRLVVGVDADGGPLIHFLDGDGNGDGNVTWSAP